MTDSLLFNFIISYLSCSYCVLVYICYNAEYKLEFYVAGAFLQCEIHSSSCR